MAIMTPEEEALFQKTMERVRRFQQQPLSPRERALIRIGRYTEMLTQATNAGDEGRARRALECMAFEMDEIPA